MRHLVQKGQGNHTDCVCRTLVWDATRDMVWAVFIPHPLRKEQGKMQIKSGRIFFFFFP